MFELWLDHDLSRLMAERDKTLCGILDAIEKAARVNGPGKPFRCVCGVTTDNPGDPEFMRVHQPHVAAAFERRAI